MSEKIIVTTTIRLPDGLVLSDEQLAGIQSIVDNGSVIDPELPTCEGNPTPMSVKVISKKKLSVEWHGVKVSPVRWIIKNFSNGSVFDQGEITPTGGFLDVELSKELVAKQYKVVLEGVKCKGSGDPLTFDNTFFEDGGGDLGKCTLPPTPKSVLIQGDKLWAIKWHGEGVYKLSCTVASKSGEVIGYQEFEPKASDNATLIMPLSKSPIPGERYSITLQGISCDGSGAMVFEVPMQEDSISVESIEVSQ